MFGKCWHLVGTINSGDFHFCQMTAARLSSLFKCWHYAPNDSLERERKKVAEISERKPKQPQQRWHSFVRHFASVYSSKWPVAREQERTSSERLSALAACSDQVDTMGVTEHDLAHSLWSDCGDWFGHRRLLNMPLSLATLLFCAHCFVCSGSTFFSLASFAVKANQLSGSHQGIVLIVC